MAIAGYDTYATSFMQVSALSSYVQFSIPTFISEGQGLIVPASQSGSLRGGILCSAFLNVAFPGNWTIGATFLHAQRDITITGSFYFVGYQGTDLVLWKFHSGATPYTTVPTTIAKVPGAVGQFTVFWDANPPGLGGTRITAYLSGVIAFDVLDVFYPRTYSSGEGLFLKGATGFDTGQGRFSIYTQYSLS